jgi:hypothetical protein
MPSSNQVDALGRRSKADDARRVVEAHQAGLQARRERDLLSEKYLLHIDGGEFQWADIVYGARVEIPRMVSEFRKTENILRVVVENAVAHHTTMPLNYYTDARSDRKSRQKALVDTLMMNTIADEQDLNSLFADAMFMGVPAGFCPVHRYWREDGNDLYEPIAYGDQQSAGGQMIQPIGAGMIDCWLGNPFDTVFDRGAKRGSWIWTSYGRVLPLSLVKQAFDHIPESRTLEGTMRIPSVAEFQRIARNWNMMGLNVHGSPVTSYRRGDPEEEEQIVIICRETAPGVLTDYPRGRLQIVAVPGAVDLLRGQGRASAAVALADQELPGADFSLTNFYSHHRGNDIHGAPWVGDLDPLQVDLNIAKSKRWEAINRMMDAPIVSPAGAIDGDMADIGGYQILEIEPSAGAWRPEMMRFPVEILTGLDAEIRDLRQAIYSAGGYQAASRGEAPGSRIAYRAIVALQQADNSIHGPVNLRFRRAACDFARGCWKQFKAYGDVGMALKATGDNWAYLAEPWVDWTKLSDTPPNYKLVNAFGASPELRAQEILELMQTKGADGKPFLLTPEARKAYPDHSIFDDAGDPGTVARRRAKTISAQILFLAETYRTRTGMNDDNIASPNVAKAAQQLFMILESRYPRLQDDDLASHLAALSEITQDETADPVARIAAKLRQQLYFQWQQQMAGGGAQPQPMTVNLALKGQDLTQSQLDKVMADEGITDDQAQPPAQNGRRAAGAPGAPAGPPPAPGQPARTGSPIDRRGIAAQVLSGGQHVPPTRPSNPAPLVASTAR